MPHLQKACHVSNKTVTATKNPEPSASNACASNAAFHSIRYTSQFSCLFPLAFTPKKKSAFICLVLPFHFIVHPVPFHFTRLTQCHFISLFTQCHSISPDSFSAIPFIPLHPLPPRSIPIHSLPPSSILFSSKRILRVAEKGERKTSSSN